MCRSVIYNLPDSVRAELPERVIEAIEKLKAPHSLSGDVLKKLGLLEKILEYLKSKNLPLTQT
jgi:hypothetical protein